MVASPSAWMQRLAAGRQSRMVRFETRLTWLSQNVIGNTQIKMSARVRLATQLLRDKIVINISVPVVKVPQKYTDKNGKRRQRTIVTERSKPGEFPRADTTRLMKDVYYTFNPATNEGRVGITLDYGVVLELRRQRSFLRRTFNELRPVIWQILTAPGARIFGQTVGQ